MFRDQELLLLCFFLQLSGFLLQAFLKPFIFLSDLFKLGAELACGLCLKGILAKNLQFLHQILKIFVNSIFLIAVK